MGHVTIVVEHGWKLENSKKQFEGIPNSYEIIPKSRLGQTTNIELFSQLAKKPLAGHVRVSVPSSIAQLVSYYNVSTSQSVQDNCQAACWDILHRIANLIKEFQIPDPGRRDPIKTNNSVKADKFNLPQPTKTSKLRNHKEELSSKNQGKFASEARISLLMLARARSAAIRDQAMLLLCEALEIDCLVPHKNEVLYVQMLWVELVQLLRQIVTVRLQREVANIQEKKIELDRHLARILSCIHLTLQRMDYFGDSIQESTIMKESYSTILKDLETLYTDDPFLLYLVSGISDQVADLKLDKFNEKEIGIEFGISILSKIHRMRPVEHMYTLRNNIEDVLDDMVRSKKWSTGEKLIRIFASIALSSHDGCTAFLQLIPGLGAKRWQWHFLAILTLGTISMSSNSPKIRRMALESGLTQSVNFNDEKVEMSWAIRAASIIVLAEIYQLCRQEAIGFLAHELIAGCKKRETHPKVLAILEAPNISVPQSSFNRKVPFLFKYIFKELSEGYSEMQNNYIYLRKELETSGFIDALKEKASKAKKRSQTKYKNRGEASNLIGRKIFDGVSFTFHRSDYHHSYRNELPFNGPLYTSYLADSKQRVQSSQLSKFHYKTKDEEEPLYGQSPGTHGRRKLFQIPPVPREEEPPLSPEIPKLPPVKIPTVPKIPVVKLL